MKLAQLQWLLSFQTLIDQNANRYYCTSIVTNIPITIKSELPFSVRNIVYASLFHATHSVDAWDNQITPSTYSQLKQIHIRVGIHKTTYNLIRKFGAYKSKLN